MKTAVIVHGKPNREEYFEQQSPSPSNHHWIPWLQKQLLIRDYIAQTPEMPKPWAPHYPAWKKEFERFEISEKTILVGHSCGAGFLVRWLSEHNKVRVGRVILVAPWLDPNRNQTKGFFDFTVDPQMAARTDGLAIFNSDNDGDEVQESAMLLHNTIENHYYKEFHNYGHFCMEDMGTDQFPELLELLTD